MPDAANIVFGYDRAKGLFYQDSSRTTLAADGDAAGSVTDADSGANRHAAGSGSTRPILRAAGISMAEDNAADSLLSSAAASSSGWAVYVLCEGTAGGSGVLWAASPFSGAVPLINTYPTFTYFSVGSSFNPVLADPGGELVRGMALNGTTLTGFVGETEGAATVVPDGVPAMTIGSPAADAYKGKIRKAYLYAVGHDATMRAAVRAAMAA